MKCFAKPAKMSICRLSEIFKSINNRENTPITAYEITYVKSRVKLYLNTLDLETHFVLSGSSYVGRFANCNA